MSERAQALEAALDEVGRFYWGLERYNHQPFREAMAKLRALLVEAPPVGVSPQPERFVDPEPECPGPECSRCSGEYCDVHITDPCDCDVAERHANDIGKPASLSPVESTPSREPLTGAELLDRFRPVEPTPPQEFIDIEPEIRVVRIYRNGSWLEDIKAGGRRHASFPAVEPTPEPPTHERCHDLVCNASRDHHRGAKGVGCSCAGRDAAYQELAALKPTGAPAPCVWQLNAGNRYSTTCGRSYSNLPWEVAEWSVCPHCTAPLTVER